MNRKKLIRIIISVVLILIIALGGVLYMRYDNSMKKIVVDLYFINEEGTGIVAKPYTIRYKDDHDKIMKTLEQLEKGASGSRRSGVIPKGARMQRITFMEDNSVMLDFSSEFLTGDNSRDILDIYAVVKTLCSTASVDSVEILVDGRYVKDSDGNELEFISASDINLETEEYSSEMQNVTLYFADKSGKQLVKERRKIKITDLQPVEKYIVNELIKGTNDSSLQTLLSDKTKLISVDNANNICYLNFTSSFIHDNAGTSEHEKLLIYSIVNSLTEISNIGRVQFYMDGKRVENFGSVEIKDYISRDTNIIRMENEHVSEQN